jgi:hypothetical protein
VMALCFAYQFTVLLPHAGIGWQAHIGGLLGGVAAGWLFRDRRTVGTAGSKTGLGGSKAGLGGSKAGLGGSKAGLGGSKAGLGGSKAGLGGSKAGQQAPPSGSP